jgi:hypothetical protein
MTSLEISAPLLGITLTVVDIGLADELTAAFTEMQRAKAEALLVVAGALTFRTARRLPILRLPIVYLPVTRSRKRFSPVV